uniref:Uncharacterized protein n=1 Tax=Anguilla anguilla TaxID=7936 RepID=A0A0E9QHU7_ANGAN
MTHWVEWCHIPVSNSFDNPNTAQVFYPDTSLATP